MKTTLDIETALKLDIGDRFNMGPVECTISAVDAFGGVPHYGFLYRGGDDSVQKAGWMPCEFVERFTGFSK